jgi:hypothetical protein
MTPQDRLVKALRLRGINSIDRRSLYLAEETLVGVGGRDESVPRRAAPERALKAQSPRPRSNAPPPPVVTSGSLVSPGRRRAESRMKMNTPVGGTSAPDLLRRSQEPS